MDRTLKIATRNSPLAMWQAQFVKKQLQAIQDDLKVEIIGMTTQGDQLIDTPLAKIGGKGLFVKELETALLNEAADIAVHSMKDVGVHLPDGLAIKSILKRHSPYDALVSNRFESLADLPENAVIGTCSLRRVCQLQHQFPQFEFKNLRGNINTRLRKLDEGQYDAIILAAAGLERMGMDDRIAEKINIDTCLPAIAQGAMGIECRSNDNEVVKLIKSINHTKTAVCVSAERAVNEVLNGSCNTPIAAYATVDAESIHVRALIGEPDGGRMFYAEVSGHVSDAHQLGVKAAEHLLEQGAQKILDKVKANLA